MIDRIFATNGVGPCYIMTALVNHLSHEAIRERRYAAYKNILPECENEVAVDIKKASFAAAMQFFGLKPYSIKTLY
jgi:hypothetical protein